ncbi:hypothetical protein F6X37_26025, partial [Paraburkholderia sp. 31.1]|nr:hypothetical protein [Paraburkholderia sp. 31.1]
MDPPRDPSCRRAIDAAHPCAQERRRTLGSVYIWNARALPREGPLARIATPRILDVFARSMTQRAALLA